MLESELSARARRAGQGFIHPRSALGAFPRRCDRGNIGRDVNVPGVAVRAAHRGLFGLFLRWRSVCSLSDKIDWCLDYDVFLASSCTAQTSYWASRGSFFVFVETEHPKVGLLSLYPFLTKFLEARKSG